MKGIHEHDNQRGQSRATVTGYNKQFQEAVLALSDTGLSLQQNVDVCETVNTSETAYQSAYIQYKSRAA